jgi:drug/metabolite transporter (DMT)-like permease
MSRSKNMGTTKTGRIEAPGRGMACMMGGGLLLTMNDGLVKWVSGDYQVGQILAFRGAAALILIAGVLLWRGEFNILQVKYPKAQLIRAVLMIASTFLFVNGLRRMPLAETIAIAFVGPIFVTALAPVILSERVGWRRWAAVLVGFAGVIVILRPGGGELNWAALLPAGAALCGASRDLLTRGISHGEASGTTLFYSTLGVALAGAVMMPFGWQTPAVGDLGLFALAGLLLSVAHFLHIETFRFAEAAVVAPFKYSSLLWAMVIGFLIWGDIPDSRTLLGAALLVGSGLYIFHREGRQSVRLST